MSTATASWDLDTLVGSLARAGWGPLADQLPICRHVLRALADVLPHGSADGRTIATQLGRVAGRSERWVRQGLKLLEALGLITWRRGRKGVPSIIRVSKRTLAGWIRCARAARRAPSRPGGRPSQPARPAGPGRPHPRHARARRSQPEVGTALTSFRGGHTPRGAVRPRPTSPQTGDDTVIWPPADEQAQPESTTWPELPAGWEYLHSRCDTCGRTPAQCGAIHPTISGHRFSPARIRTRSVLYGGGSRG